ncbi:NUDIX hydrolase [Streptomyces sp. A7024]|uniref:NUDIX hydrolase n=1 Tax=Streptomyces coryli TaxID=1128680 RepID=A0A6G4UEL6_9ACTN|nr:NUDIX hydrolase [Streptomyces coryli]NGN70340.1 NUDIX hydrolase [Streptomyces coryli]
MTDVADNIAGDIAGNTAGKGPIRAAGCVLWRSSPRDGTVEIALVHRPKYDDWSHPKGKLKRGEQPLAGAVREVAEETGYACSPGVRLPSLRYEVGGRDKTVSYWEAEATSGTFQPNNEVDHLIWLPPPMARRRLSYAHDREVLDAMLSAVHAA